MPRSSSPAAVIGFLISPSSAIFALTAPRRVPECFLLCQNADALYALLQVLLLVVAMTGRHGASIAKIWTICFPGMPIDATIIISPRHGTCCIVSHVTTAKCRFHILGAPRQIVEFELSARAGLSPPYWPSSRRQSDDLPLLSQACIARSRDAAFEQIRVYYFSTPRVIYFQRAAIS